MPSMTEHELQMQREEHDHNIYAKRVNIVGANGNQVNVTSDNKLEVNASLSTAGLATDTNQETQIRLTKNTLDMFGQQVMGQRYNQFEVAFNGTDPDLITSITITKKNGGDAATANGQAVFSTSTNTSGEIKVITNTNIDYQPHFEVYAAFTAIFTVGVANSFQRIGIYDDNNGFFIGYEGTSFGVTKRTGGVDTTTAKASFNIDTLTGATGSHFTRDGVPEAIDLTKDNLFRIRYGWLGAAPIIFEVFSPDGEWVAFHLIRHPNSASVPTLTSTTLPMRLHIKKTTAGATNLIMNTACWAAGATTDLQKLTFAITDDSLVKPVRSILAAKMPSGAYTNIDATAGGNLKVSIEEADPSSGVATSALQTTGNNYLQAIAGLVPSAYDYISLSYTGSNLTGVVYKTGGSGGTTVATLTLAYDGSNNLTSVTKS